MKLSTLALIIASSLSLVACAAETAAPVDDDAEDTDVSQDELNAAAKRLVGKYEWRAADSGSFLEFERLELSADGTYTASVDSGLVDPRVRCFKFPCTLPEAGKWSTFKSGGKSKIRFRPSGHPSRSYVESKVNDLLTLSRKGESTILFQLGAVTCANVRCVAGTHCEMKGINGGAIPVCIKDPAPAPCVRTGCSGQICADRHMGSTCEMRSEYACYRSATCERQVGGACGWTQTPALSACLANN